MTKILVEKAIIDQALEALEEIGDEWGFTSKRTLPNRVKAITAMREALAEQAEQEPIENNDWKKASYIRETLNAEQAEQEQVAYHVTAGRKVSDGMQVVFSNDEILYAAPVRTKDLTDDELDVFFNMYWQGKDDADVDLIEVFRAVIAADRKKNNV